MTVTSQLDVFSGTSEANATNQLNGTAQLDLDDVYYEVFLDRSRFWAQRVFTPILCITGIIVNCLTILVFSQRRLRSSTNMYLKALAAFDLLYLTSVLALSVYRYPHYHPYFLYYQPYGLFITDYASNASVWLTAGFTIERFVVVGNPMKHLKYATARFARKVVLTIACFCFIATFTTVFEQQVVHHFDNQTNITTLRLEPTKLGESKIYQTGFYWFTTVTFVFIPFLIIATLNFFLLRSLREARTIRSSLSPATLASETRTTFLLVVVILIFLLCQGPAAIMLIITLFNPNTVNNFYRGLNNILNLLVAVNACANFFLYVGLSVKFRKTFLSLLFLQMNRKLSGRSMHITQQRFSRPTNGYNLANGAYGW